MSHYMLKPKPLRQESFADFGEVVDTQNHKDIREINYGMTKRYNNLATLDLLQDNGQPLFNIFMSTAVILPFCVKVIERHPLSSQLFFPVGRQPFLVLVADAESPPAPENLKLFITNGTQGVNFNKNTWHHYLLAINQNAKFIVIDRGGEEVNCEEYFFHDDIVIEQI